MLAARTDSSATTRPARRHARPGEPPDGQGPPPGHVLRAERPRLAGVSLSIGIVGLPNVGKSTLFNALTRASAVASNYPFATIEPNVGIVGIPDLRLAALAGLYDSTRIVPAAVRLVDMEGLIRGAAQELALGNQSVPHITDTDPAAHEAP